jgi:Zn-finger nucleic acid-binding protein
MDCPRCRLPLRRTEYEDATVDVCDACWGFWFDSGELSQVLRSKKLEFSDEEKTQILDVRSASKRQQEDPVPCPRCGRMMDQVVYDESVHLVIDRCPQHGIWLDTGEVKKVQAVSEQSVAIHRMLVRKLGLR